jgi:DNA helicase II / ATP-dependent DNA helicase PcrA
MEHHLSFLDSLNSAQRTAVELGDGPALVSAGPGSGKTRVLTHRVAYLIRALGVPSYNIMAVTFTNKAAREMKERLEQLVGSEGESLTIGTFHAICARILRREAHHLGMTRSFVIYDTADQLAAVKQALKDLNLDDKLYPPRAILHTISRAKDELIGPAQYDPPTYWHEGAARAYARYQEILEANGAVDFDDLLVKAVRLLCEQPEVRARYQRRYRYILVDEFQDTNTSQYELVKQLAGHYRNLFVVGDSDQSIYGWRGANIANLQSFRKDFGDAEMVLLEQNYRSTQDILDAAHHVISRNPGRQDKRLWTENSARRPLIVNELYDEGEEAQYILGEIRRLVRNGECKLGDCAVMYRTNAQSRVIEDAFVKAHMPYRLVGATRFYSRREIKDVIAYLRLVHSDADNVSLGRVINTPPRRIGAKTLSRLGEWAGRMDASMAGVLRLLAAVTRGAPEDAPLIDQYAYRIDLAAFNRDFTARPRQALLGFWRLKEGLVQASHSLDLLGLLDLLLESTGYAAYVRDGTEEGEERWSNIMELRSVAQEYVGLEVEESLPIWLEQVALVSDVDNLEGEQDAATLLTLHAAKGLEFPTVFMIGMEEGLLPHSRSLEEPDGIQEERRICYVGITRAKERLYLTHAFRRTIYGSQALSEPSRFLADIPDELVRGREARKKGASRAPLGPMTISASSRARATQRPKPRPQAPTVRRMGIEPARAEDSSLERRRSRAKSRSVAAQFNPGDQVRHAEFGDGTVISSSVSGGDELVTVAFDGRGVKRLAASFANLERVA